MPKDKMPRKKNYKTHKEEYYQKYRTIAQKKKLARKRENNRRKGWTPQKKEIACYRYK